MPVAQLNWSQAAWVGAGLLVLALVLARLPSARLRRASPFAREAAVIALLYSLWQWVGALAEHGAGGAYARARWIEGVEADWRLPSEASLQPPLLEHRWIGQAADLYYASMHFTVLFFMLVWVFWRHRDAYGRVRTALVGFTFLALIVQLIPVAPPRLLPGYVDVAAVYDQSVYGIGGVSVDELSAMPSVHVGWAVLVAGAVLWLGSGPLRGLGVAHAVVTIWVVVATGNHWWLDGIAAITLLGGFVGIQYGWYRVRRRRRPGAERVSGSAGQRDADDAVVGRSGVAAAVPVGRRQP